MKTLILFLISLISISQVEAFRGAAVSVRGGGMGRGVTVNRNVAVVGGGYHGYHAPPAYYHPVATAAVVTGAAVVTAAAIGSVVHSLPSSCITSPVGGVTYTQCGSTWYQPQYVGSTVQYVVVNPPK